MKSKTHSKKKVLQIAAALLILLLGLFLINRNNENTDNSAGSSAQSNFDNSDVPSALIRSDLNVDFSKSSIDLEQVLSGGPGKDGIPALSDPKFESLSESEVDDDTQVVYVEHNGEEKLYPLSILVWHEIANDEVGGKPLAITFCPLCGSAIVFEREVDGDVLEFGVSGFLYESNLLMYSRENSENLWSQSLGKSVVGAREGTTLEHYPLQLLSFADAKKKFPDATIMSTDTGHSRNYKSTPYSGYSDTEDTFFPVSVSDKRFPGKEIFYVVPLEGSNSIAVRQNKEDGTYDVPDTDIKVTFDKGLITANWGSAELPGYFEMWFSWATHNSETGILLD